MKKEYKKPTAEVVKIQQVQMLCASEPDILEGTSENWYELE